MLHFVYKLRMEKNMARTLFRIILIILLCFTFYKIFQFSSENAEVSGSRSTEIMRKILKI